MRIAIFGGARDAREKAAQLIGRAGHFPESIYSTEELLRKASRSALDAVYLVLERDSARPTGLEHALTRPEFAEVPLLISTGVDELAHLQEVLRGSDRDFIVRPHCPAEFELRFDALLERTRRRSFQPILEFGPYRFQMGRQIVQWSGNVVRLRRREFEVALIFFNRLGRLVRRDELLRSIWRRTSNEPSRLVDAAVSRVRISLGLVEGGTYMLTSVYRQGYRLDRTDPIDGETDGVDISHRAAGFPGEPRGEAMRLS
ncbi:DNA-binding response OmpR family regulator [Variovorax boronicumulans]|uniref:response regulator transcription factor n=1 Tax=Variovorax boronicumulans TaxID=436515 RepID=UPI00278B6C60|nr:winged helix-turn-helix domain-containing protein [Variovorax boronicumulans]MDQ0083795.1 DNA-binding response OmpR family regulator [Variovorax boronicumulans]